ncbi:MAG: hypothetical protein A3I07_01380 [Candidatus Doudnabacteria bacterium RIFCSPLOWO2_02_FULL_42_9]|uniref:Ribbon-helix-helix protein CopG domain-containing protein n=1 Tax=Candidatus Doudnabacteria bacterium RIFCSPHIGHO2_01_FULL_41_86 TaxID=1817821 RepID=A0A1F5N922_9BACT|nr:MAG: hypothetical protein A2717_00940 [Candidatus Doudnabacteria bacterium RIFCSPHIGHO2_01_FULL_41_86]OGE75409.1 MAG: hypothetical protein A3K07_01455 [Candidatus Doudnabacteria bacterium RIFCSPHIGHO2_01_43_10]OGE86565.1 MAG: hypothetical protein A3E28_04115 [Candidatus Doudnabacteria bacterium RIFCSPHIGHO2_12_FULL_42_22]OGE87465.1 MAG: hypothetical protein A3C49_03775 [Candidatus Doudnabacteria bacterium RIFCSPHIGHO2_02_FULL_42_25]OGE92800.1 MAG: hypothetical protein A2895_04740 [Candidatus
MAGSNQVVVDDKLRLPNSSKPKRVTLVMPANLDMNIELVALYEGRAKSRLIKEALAWYLKEKKGIPDPLQAPDVSWSTPQK